MLGRIEEDRALKDRGFTCRFEEPDDREDREGEESFPHGGMAKCFSLKFALYGTMLALNEREVPFGKSN